MTKQFVLVCYDIPNDRRRTRLHNTLTQFGTPVQFSVFECLLEAREIEKMRRAVQRVIKQRLDHVRYYFLCAACQARIESTQAGGRTGAEHAEEQDAWVV